MNSSSTIEPAVPHHSDEDQAEKIRRIGGDQFNYLWRVAAQLAPRRQHRSENAAKAQPLRLVLAYGSGFTSGDAAIS